MSGTDESHDPSRVQVSRVLAGFAGSVLLAVAGYLAGALPSGDPGAGFREGWFSAVSGRFTAGLICWVLGGALLALAWLRIRPATVRSAVLIGLLWAAPLLLAPPLGSRDGYAYACQGWIWLHGHDPYSLGVAQAGCPWTASVPQIWWETPAPYGPFAVLLSGLSATTGSQLATLTALRLLALLAAALLATQLPRLAVHCGASPVLATRLALLSPLLLIHGLSATHNDLILTALLITALTLATAPRLVPSRLTPPRLHPLPGDNSVEGRRSRAGLAGGAEHPAKTGAKAASPVELRARDASPAGGAVQGRTVQSEVGQGGAEQGPTVHGDAGQDGVRQGGTARGAVGRAGAWDSWVAVVVVGLLLAAAVGVKVTAIVAAPFVLLLLGRRWWMGALAGVGGFAGLSWATGLGLGWVSALKGTGELAQWSSPPTAVGMAAGYLLRPFGVNSTGPIAVARVVGVIVLAGFGVLALRWAWQRRGDTRSVVVACGAALAATALLGPVFYPWYALAPLTVLAATGLKGSTDVTASREARSGPQRTSEMKVFSIVTLVCTFLTLPNGLGVPVLTKAVGAFAVTVLVFALVALRKRATARGV